MIADRIRCEMIRLGLPPLTGFTNDTALQGLTQRLLEHLRMDHAPGMHRIQHNGSQLLCDATQGWANTWVGFWHPQGKTSMTGHRDGVPTVSAL